MYSDPKAPESWSDQEVAERWLKVFPGKLEEPKFKKQREMRIQAIQADDELLAKYRQRLGSISWLMRRINEPLAKLSNTEDCCKGHFWESRFKSQALLDEAAALTCMAYVDLNPIRAGMAQRLEESDYTSIKKRLVSMSEEKLQTAISSVSGQVRNQTMRILLKDYIELVEWTGKNIVYPGKSQIPLNLATVFERLNLNQENWLNQVQNYGGNYYRVVGCFEKILERAKTLRQNWLKGINAVKSLYA